MPGTLQVRQRQQRAPGDAGLDRRRAATMFWSLGQGGPAKPLAEGEVAITEPLARELDVEVGDDDSAADSERRARFRPTVRSARKNDTSLGRRLRVGGRVAADGTRAVRLAADAAVAAQCVRAARRRCRTCSNKPGQANAILVGRPTRSTRPTKRPRRVASALRPRLEDYGLQRRARSTSPTDYVSNRCRPIGVAGRRGRGGREGVSERRAAADRHLSGQHAGRRRAATRSERFRIRRSPASIRSPRLGPLLDEAGQPIVLADDEIVLNRWAADDLQREGRRHGDGHLLRAGEHARRAARASSRRSNCDCAHIVELETATASRRRPPIRS